MPWSLAGQLACWKIFCADARSNLSRSQRGFRYIRFFAVYRNTLWKLEATLGILLGTLMLETRLTRMIPAEGCQRSRENACPHSRTISVYRDADVDSRSRISTSIPLDSQDPGQMVANGGGAKQTKCIPAPRNQHEGAKGCVFNGRRLSQQEMRKLASDFCQ